MRRTSLMAAGVLGIVAVALYVGATIVGGLLDPSYSQVRNAVSELTGATAPDSPVLAPLFIAYNVTLFAFSWALFRASSNRRLFAVGAAFLAIGGLSGIGQVTLFRMEAAIPPVTTEGTMHVVLASVSSLLCVATAVLYGLAFRREPTFHRLWRYSVATAALVVLTAPLAVGSIGTDLMGLFERITIGVYLAWVVVVSVHCLLATRSEPAPVGGRAPAAI